MRCWRPSKSFRCNPKIALVWYNVERTFRFLVRDHDEIKAFGRALPIDPGLHEAWSSHAFGLSRAWKFDEAIQEYEKELGLAPASTILWYNKGVALDTLGRYEEALKAYDTAVRKNPDSCGRVVQ